MYGVKLLYSVLSTGGWVFLTGVGDVPLEVGLNVPVPVRLYCYMYSMSYCMYRVQYLYE